VTDPDDLATAKERGWRELSPIDEELASGLLDEAEWHRRVLAIIEPAYLAASTLQGQSGHSGDAERWELARRLILDAVDRSGTFLDVGCANGLLMESVAVWAAEDGHAVAPYGVEISAALAELARDRLPAWAGRIWTANASVFEPPRRFTYDYLDAEVSGWGYPVAGRTSRQHRHPALSYKAFWIDAADVCRAEG